MLKNKRLVVFGIVGALILLLGGVGIVYAQGPRDQSLRDEGRFGRRAYDRAPARGGPMRCGPFQGLVQVTAEVIGLSEDEVITALEDGQTLAGVAEAEGVEPQAIVDAAIAEAEARLQEAVDEGRLTEEQMERRLERLAENLPERLEQPWQPGGPKGESFGQLGKGFWTMHDAVAEALGLTPEELFTELHGGKSMADVAEEQGVEMEAIRDAVEDARIEARKEAIEQAVEDGRLSEEHADWMMEGLEQGFISGKHGFGRGQGFGPGQGGRGRGKGW